jgi:uncharacterized membrane protein YcaP (DUF421 family)
MINKKRKKLTKKAKPRSNANAKGHKFWGYDIIIKVALIVALAIIPALALAGQLNEDGVDGTVLRVTGIYLIIFVILRLLGKREFSQLSLIELISLILVPDLVSQGVVGENSSFLNAIVAVMTLFTLVAATSLIIANSKSLEKVMMGEPTTLLEDGKIIKESLECESVTEEEILAAARKQGVRYLDEVELATLETDGTISVVPTERGGSSKAKTRKL